MNWNHGDWIAFFGGKYSVWHSWQVNYYSDDNIKYKGHHDNFYQMIRKVDAKYPSIILDYVKANRRRH